MKLRKQPNVWVIEWLFPDTNLRGLGTFYNSIIVAIREFIRNPTMSACGERSTGKGHKSCAEATGGSSPAL